MVVVGEVDSAARDCPTVRVDHSTTVPRDGKDGTERKGMGKEINGKGRNKIEWNEMEGLETK